MNCYLIRKRQDQITLRDIRENFPVPGDYHFRFQYSYQKSGVTVWLDLCSEDSPVPAIEQEIRVKVTRHSWHEGRIADLDKQIHPKLAKQIDMYLM